MTFIIKKLNIWYNSQCPSPYVFETSFKEQRREV